MPQNVLFMSEQYLFSSYQHGHIALFKADHHSIQIFLYSAFIDYHDSSLYHTQFPVDEEYSQTSLDGQPNPYFTGYSHVPHGFFGNSHKHSCDTELNLFKLIGQVTCSFIKKCICSRICTNFLSVFYGIKVVEQ